MVTCSCVTKDRGTRRITSTRRITITTTATTKMWTLFVLLIVSSLCTAQLEGQARTSYACEGSTMKITCSGNRVINILRANYGRFNFAVCNEDQPIEDWDDHCMSTRSLKIVLELCQEKENCWIPATNRMFGDPCSNTPKYLEVHYRCAKDERTTPKYQTRPPLTPSPVTTSTTESSSTSTESSTSSSSASHSSSSTKGTTPIPPTEPPNVLPRSCDSVYNRDIMWPATSPGNTAFEICPNNQFEMAEWLCRADGQWWGNPDLSRCVSPETEELNNKLLSDAPTEIGSTLVEITEEDLYGGDVVEITKVMNELISEVEEEAVTFDDASFPSMATEMIDNVNKAMVKTGSNLLDPSKNESWRDLPQAEQRKSATQLIKAIEDSAEQVASRVDSVPQAPIINIEVNIVMEVTVVDTTGEIQDVVFPDVEKLKNSKWEKNKDSIRLTSGAVKEFSFEGLAKLIFMTYDNLDELLKPQKDHAHQNLVNVVQDVVDEDKYKVSDNGHNVNKEDSKEQVDEVEVKGAKEEVVSADGEVPVPSEEERQRGNKIENKIVNSKIISATIPGREKDDNEMIMLPPGEGVVYTLEHKTTNNVFNPTCSFWEYSEKSLDGHWSDFGCELIDTNVTHTVCSCNHLTNFAVLMDVMGTELASHHRITLSLITYIGCLISILCLFLAWLTFQFCKNLQCDRNTIHKNLVLVLCLAEIVFLAGIAQYDREFLCSLIAAALHYLFLAAFAWMCLEGVQLYVMLIEVFEAEKSRIKLYYLAAYGIPAIIVCISAAVDYTGYGTPNYCWLSVKNGFIFAFVGPVIAVIAVNFVMLSIAIYMMCKHASIAAQYKMKEKSRIENIRSWLKGAFVLVVLLGLTWSFGLLYISEQTVVMAYLFTILNSLQGLFIFIFHCAMNEKVQKEYKRCIRHARFLPDSVRIKYGGMKPYTSSSPHSSSTGGNYLQKLWSGRRRKRSSLTSLQRSSTPSTKCEYKPYPNMKVEYLNSSSQDTGGTPVSPGYNDDRQVSNFSTDACTEDPMGYLEPVKIRITDSYFDGDGINGDLSQIEGSVVDSDYLMDYGRKPPINIEKYKIKSPNDNSRLSAISNSSKPGEFTESEFSDGELFRMTEKEKMLNSENEYEELPMAPPVPKTVSEENLINKLDNDLTLKRNLQHNVESPSLNDLNKEASDGSSNSLCISTPNIKYKTDTIKSRDSNTASRDSPTKRSLPNISTAGSSAGSSAASTPPARNTSPTLTPDPAMDKIRKALSNNDDVINLYHGKTDDKRFSEATENAMKSNHVRYSSSDC